MNKQHCPKCHRDSSVNRWSMNGHDYNECGRCGHATLATREVIIDG